MILKIRFFELLEAKHKTQALTLLRKSIQPTSTNPKATHRLATYLLSKDLSV